MALNETYFFAAEDGYLLAGGAMPLTSVEELQIGYPQWALPQKVQEKPLEQISLVANDNPEFKFYTEPLAGLSVDAIQTRTLDTKQVQLLSVAYGKEKPLIISAYCNGMLPLGSPELQKSAAQGDGYHKVTEGNVVFLVWKDGTTVYTASCEEEAVPDAFAQQGAGTEFQLP